MHGLRGSDEIFWTFPPVAKARPEGVRRGWWGEGFWRTRLLSEKSCGGGVGMDRVVLLNLGEDMGGRAGFVGEEGDLCEPQPMQERLRLGEG